MGTHAERFAALIAEAEHWAAEKQNRAEQLTALAAERVRTMPTTIGDRPVTVEDVAYAAIVGDTIRKDMEANRAKAVTDATMYGLAAILEALTTRPAPPSTHTTRE